MIRLLLPLQRCWRVAMVFRCGHVSRFTCLDLTKREKSDGELTHLGLKGAIDEPFVWRLADVAVVEAVRGWRWRR